MDPGRRRQGLPEPSGDARRRDRERGRSSRSPRARRSRSTVNLTSVPGAGRSTARWRSSACRRTSPRARASCSATASSARSGSCPAAPKPASAPATIKPGKGTAVLPVKNTGNTIDAVSGNGLGQGLARHAQPDASQAVKILPGKTINIPLGTKLAEGQRHGQGHAQPEGQDGAHAHQEVHGEVMGSTRPIRRFGGYVRLRVGWYRRVLGLPVVMKRDLEGTQ